ncbi:HNH endonuclease [Campylobacter mucosalis]|uniref:HNH endonuclease n=1 Tax=Campylobacter mucosalis CCUG 21559 TaxID=1032067 RepID=A0A6G5QH92_9BACT|nr:HNH endonuclease [Campylobacter mucosalis]QCD44947.1 hypothetical protein CMUC_1173 [Campylobacter mucosalis CCUG 21559]
MGNAGSFKKGMTPWNKGLKGVMKSNATSFKKGNVPHNHRPVGSIRITNDGIRIKVTEPKGWVNLSVLVYTQYYKDEIRKDEIIITKDKNIFNLNPENLLKVSRAEHGAINRSFSDDPAELKEVRLAQIKLKKAIKKVKNEKNTN